MDTLLSRKNKTLFLIIRELDIIEKTQNHLMISRVAYLSRILVMFLERCDHIVGSTDPKEEKFKKLKDLVTEHKLMFEKIQDLFSPQLLKYVQEYMHKAIRSSVKKVWAT